MKSKKILTVLSFGLVAAIGLTSCSGAQIDKKQAREIFESVQAKQSEEDFVLPTKATAYTNLNIVATHSIDGNETKQDSLTIVSGTYDLDNVCSYMSLQQGEKVKTETWKYYENGKAIEAMSMTLNGEPNGIYLEFEIEKDLFKQILMKDDSFTTVTSLFLEQGMGNVNEILTSIEKESDINYQYGYDIDSDLTQTYSFHSKGEGSLIAANDFKFTGSKDLQDKHVSVDIVETDSFVIENFMVKQMAIDSVQNISFDKTVITQDLKLDAKVEWTSTFTKPDLTKFDKQG